jgi:small nuclear ribonucleoprotein (snRNP)-like protein
MANLFLFTVKVLWTAETRQNGVVNLKGEEVVLVIK